MRKEYDFSKAKKNPHASRLKREALLASESAKKLARLGGTEKGLETPRRRRPK